jgi:hypothetical protein
MPTLPILDLAIGLSFIYLLLALSCTTLNEMIASLLKLRPRNLEKGIARMLGDPALKTAIYRHPLIKSLANAAGNSPSYIPPSKFALALLDVADTTEQQNSTFQGALAAIRKDSSALDDQHKIEMWFEDSMDRVSGRYKRGAQARALLLAVLITLLLNADTLKIVQMLRTHPLMTAALVEKAKVRLNKGRPDEEALPMVKYEKADSPNDSAPIILPDKDAISADEQKALGEFTGWGNDLFSNWKKEQENLGKGFRDWISFILSNRLLGWIITALAVSIGAPFWFDTLNRFMNIRNAGRAPDEPRDKANPVPTPGPPPGSAPARVEGHR